MAYSYPSEDADHDTAPRFPVPNERIVAVEHPCVVKNVDKASEMLGGSKAIAATLEEGSNKTLGLKFTPSGKDIISFNNRTDNVLLRISAPKVIGKRKRGSADPFQPLNQGDIRENASFILRSMQDNPGATTISPLGAIESTHVFRSIPDLVYPTPTSFLQHDIKAKLFSPDYDTIRQFQLPHMYGAREDEILPPPVLSSVALPQYYSYVEKQHAKSAAAIAKLEDKEYIIGVNDLDPAWPTAVKPNVPLLNTQSERTQALVRVLKSIFEKRPIWTRRALINCLPPEAHVTLLRRALAYVAFYIRSGPWRDTICRFGVDPRKAASYGQYQIVNVRLSLLTGRAHGWFRSRNPRDHLYTGKEPVQQYDNRLFQLCDITDPLLLPLIGNVTRAECDPVHFGWYQNGTFSKIVTILRAKMEAGISGAGPVQVDGILGLPDHLDLSGDTHPTASGSNGYLPDSASEGLKELAAEYRQTIRTSENKRVRRLEALDPRALPPVDQITSPAVEPVVSVSKPAFEQAWDTPWV